MLKFAAVVLAAGVCLNAAMTSDIEFGRAQGVPLLLDAFVPEGAGPFPAIIWVHGGGFVAGDKAPYPKTLLDPLAKEGYAWFSVNYRLAPKYPFPAETDDVESAVRFIKAHAREYKVDPKRLVLMGESAGGHLVSFVGAKHDPGNGVAAVVSFYGEHDLVERTHTKGPCMVDGKVIPNPGPICLSPGLAKFLGISEPGPDAERIIKEASPATYVKKSMPAYLLIHGSKDFNVPVEQSYLMRDAMKKAGANVEVIVVEGGAHGRGTLEKAGGPDAFQPAMTAWLKKVLH